jgi:hypothetical protein
MGPGLALMMVIPIWMAFKLDLSFAGQMKIQSALAERRTHAQDQEAPRHP